MQPNVAATFDSRGFIYLKMGEWDSAIADYSSALQLDPKLASSLYGRGLAKLKKRETIEGNADVAAAKELDGKYRRGVCALRRAVRTKPRASTRSACSRGGGKRVQFGHGLNCLIDIENA